MPQLDLQDLNGGHHKLQDYKGRIVVLNFWATWCVPCASEMPLLDEMQKRYKDKIIVVAASIDDPVDRDKLKPFLHEHKADDLTLLTGATLDTLSEFRMGMALPATVFFDADGRIVSKSEGALKRADLEHRLEMMTGAAGPTPEQNQPKQEKAQTKHEK